MLMMGGAYGMKKGGGYLNRRGSSMTNDGAGKVEPTEKVKVIEEVEHQEENKKVKITLKNQTVEGTPVEVA